MKKIRNRYAGVLHVTAFIILFSLFFAAGCSVRDRDNTKQFIITDQATGKVIDSYEYDKTDGALVKSTTYGEDSRANKIAEYSYDSAGELQSVVIQESGSPTSTTRTIDYTLQKEYDDQGRLIKTTQTSSEGKTVETYYGYDETGELRGVVQKGENDSLLMMDY